MKRAFFINKIQLMYNHYHPAVKLRLYMGISTENDIQLINKRTLYHWKNINESELIGYDPNDSFIKNKKHHAFIHHHQSAVKVLNAYMILFSCFKSVVHSAKQTNSLFRKNKTKIIKAFNESKNLIKISEFESLTGISSKKIYRWQNEIKCENSIFKHCKKQNPQQLTFAEQNFIFNEIKDENNFHLHLCDIWAKLVRFGKVKCKLETFYRYSRIIIQKFEIKRKLFKRKTVVISAKKPLTVLHVDSTMVGTDDGNKWYLNIIYDNYSKAILGIKAMLNPNSLEVAKNLKEVIINYQLQDKSFLLYCDGGPENKGDLDDLLKKFPLIKKMTTCRENGIHNNMIESFNAKFKRKLIHLLNLSVHKKVPEQLLNLKISYNNTPMALIGTLTPNEVLTGKIPFKDLWPEIENEIKNAKAERIFINQLTCCME